MRATFGLVIGLVRKPNGFIGLVPLAFGFGFGLGVFGFANPSDFTV